MDHVKFFTPYLKEVLKNKNNLSSDENNWLLKDFMSPDIKLFFKLNGIDIE